MKNKKLRDLSAIILSILSVLSLVGSSLMLARPSAARVAATITVTSAEDAGGTCPGANCTLRQAILTAAEFDTINFAGGISTINLTSGELYIDKSLTITGPGADLLTVQRSPSAGTLFRVFSINALYPTITGITISNGFAYAASGLGAYGGGIFYTSSSDSIFSILNCAFTSNFASFAGGGIANIGGRVYISYSNISSNNVTSEGSALGGGGGGGIYNTGELNLDTSTVSGNSATPVGLDSFAGGGIYSVGATAIGNSTISFNSSYLGGGIFRAAGASGTVDAVNDIIAKNTDVYGSPDVSGTLTSYGYNLIGNTAGTTITSTTTGNQLNVDPLLGPLQDNGGPTRTHALLAGSPALDVGFPFGNTVDQRGFPRPIDLPSIPNLPGGTGTDIGAYEAQGTPTPPPTPSPTPTYTSTNTPSATPTPPASCIPEMISWWPGEENALDILSHNNGTLQNGAAFAQGEVGRTFSFDGVDDAVFVGNPPSLNLTTITIEAWVNTNNFPVGTITNVVAKWGGDGTVDSYLLGLINNGGVIQVFGAIGDGVTGDSGASGGSVSTNTWTHIAMTYNSATGTNRLYLNGVGVASRTRTGGIYQTATNVYIGREDSAGGRFFNGMIDEPTIYNRALSGGEIQAIYDTGSLGKCTGGSAGISGTITYGNAIGNPVPPRFVKNVSLSSTVGSPSVGPIITGTPGTYTLTGFGASSYTIKPTKPGGPNGAIGSADAARVAQAVAGTNAFVGQNQRFTADATGNGGANPVSSQDAAFIARFAAGLSGTGRTGQWFFFVTGAPSPLPTAPQTYNDSRSYASITSSVTGEDYIALLVGDVTGNWNPATHARPGRVGSGQMSDVSEDGGGPERGVSVELPQFKAATDKEIVIPVSVQGAADKEIISYEFDLRYDPSVIHPLENPVDVARTVSRGLMVVTNPYEPGFLRVVVYGPLPIDENGLLLNLRFTAVGAVGSTSPLTFERIIFNEGDPKTVATNGQVELSSAAPNQTEIGFGFVKIR